MKRLTAAERWARTKFGLTLDQAEGCTEVHIKDATAWAKEHAVSPNSPLGQGCLYKLIHLDDLD